MKGIKIIKIWSYYILGCGIILFVLFRLFGTVSTQLILKIYGEKKKAVVKKVWIYKAYPHGVYEFEVDGVKYQGEKGVFPIDAAVGDSISISFLPSNPEVSMISENE